jgi:hypothetical protein
MGKKWNFFLSLARIAEELADGLQVLEELIKELESLKDELREGRAHREAIYRLLVEEGIRKRST